MLSSGIQLNIKSAFSTKLRRFSFVVGVHLIALTVSWWNLTRMHPQEPVPFLESVGISMFLGFTALPLSAGHLLFSLGDKGIISVGGRPGLFLLELIVSFLVFYAFVIFITKGKKVLGLIASIYMLIAAPYWGYYSFALMGI